MGGTLGTLLVGFLADTEANPNLKQAHIKNLVGNGLWLEQTKAGLLVLLLSVVGTVVLYWVVNALVGCRVDTDVETQGLDLAEHGEDGYSH